MWLLIPVIIMGMILYILNESKKANEDKALSEKELYERSSYKRASNVSFDDANNDKGYIGEYLIFEMLKRVGGFRRIIVNAYIPANDNDSTTEIDLILVHETGIYVVESKNYSGWIFGDEGNKNWMQMFNKNAKQPFYNPIWQNNTHIKYLNSFLNDLDRKYFKSLIVFGDKCSIKKMNVVSEDVKVIRREDLDNTLESMIKSSKVRLSLDEIEDIYSRLKPFTLKTEEEKMEHIDNVRKYSV